jgi:hypothetical protein
VKHPIQPLVTDPHGTVRFQENKIVRWMLERGKAGVRFDLNDIATGDFSDDDLMQLAMLIGYSVSGFGDLSYADPEVVAACDLAADRLVVNCSKGLCTKPATRLASYRTAIAGLDDGRVVAVQPSCDEHGGEPTYPLPSPPRSTP